MKKLALTDFLKYRYPSALELSPDGRYLAFALKETDREGDGYRWNLWLCDLESGESRQITRGDAQTPMFSTRPQSWMRPCGRGDLRRSGRYTAAWTCAPVKKARRSASLCP